MKKILAVLALAIVACRTVAVIPQTPTVVPPTIAPTFTATMIPTDTPTSVPTSTPTLVPTNTPTSVPISIPVYLIDIGRAVNDSVMLTIDEIYDIEPTISEYLSIREFGSDCLVTNICNQVMFYGDGTENVYLQVTQYDTVEDAESINALAKSTSLVNGTQILIPEMLQVLPNEWLVGFGEDMFVYGCAYNNYFVVSAIIGSPLVDDKIETLLVRIVASAQILKIINIENSNGG